jgi:hypothetical protein
MLLVIGHVSAGGVMAVGELLVTLATVVKPRLRAALQAVLAAEGSVHLPVSQIGKLVCVQFRHHPIL